jgi:hypothetical protein
VLVIVLLLDPAGIEHDYEHEHEHEHEPAGARTDGKRP